MPDSSTVPRLSSTLDARTSEALASLDDADLGNDVAEVRRQIGRMETQRLSRRGFARPAVPAPSGNALDRVPHRNPDREAALSPRRERPASAATCASIDCWPP